MGTTTLGIICELPFSTKTTNAGYDRFIENRFTDKTNKMLLSIQAGYKRGKKGKELLEIEPR